MNARRLTPPLLIALAVSGVCTFALGKKLDHHAPQQLATVRYLAVNQPMQAGDVLQPGSLHPLLWPAGSPVTGAYTDVAALQGRALLYPVEPNQPLTDKLVGAQGAGAGLAGRIPPGMRAIALKSDEVVGVAGFLLPGSHVDVLVTYRTDRVPDPRTATVVQNAEVIAAGHQVQPDPQGKPATVDVVTLLLSPADAERAVLASTQGTVHFVLRGGADQARTADTGILLSELGSPDGAPHVTAAAPAPAPAVKVRAASRPAAPPAPVHQTTVQTIIGDKQVNATFAEGGR